MFFREAHPPLLSIFFVFYFRSFSRLWPAARSPNANPGGNPRRPPILFSARDRATNKFWATTSQHCARPQFNVSILFAGSSIYGGSARSLSNGGFDEGWGLQPGPRSVLGAPCQSSHLRGPCLVGPVGASATSGARVYVLTARSLKLCGSWPAQAIQAGPSGPSGPPGPPRTLRGPGEGPRGEGLRPPVRPLPLKQTRKKLPRGLGCQEMRTKVLLLQPLHAKVRESVPPGRESGRRPRPLAQRRPPTPLPPVPQGISRAQICLGLGPSERGRAPAAGAQGPRAPSPFGLPRPPLPAAGPSLPLAC